MRDLPTLHFQELQGQKTELKWIKNKFNRRLYGTSNILPSGGVKKLKKESLGTVLVTTLTVPRPLCFCFFLIVFNVTFLPFTQSIVQLWQKRKNLIRVCNWQNKLEPVVT